MADNEWTPPPVTAPPAGSSPAGFPPAPSRRRGLAVKVGLVGAGVAAGAIAGTTFLSSAATSSSAPNSAAPPSSQCQGGHRGPHLNLSGTVTAVGSSSVTIKTGSGTTTYQVDANSDIDKNGEAQLSSLKVGDAVRFSVRGGNVIGILHAGNEALDRPPMGPGPGYGG